jgi:hypothetical protein
MTVFLYFVSGQHNLLAYCIFDRREGGPKLAWKATVMDVEIDRWIDVSI